MTPASPRDLRSIRLARMLTTPMSLPTAVQQQLPHGAGMLWMTSGQGVNHVTGIHQINLARPERFELPTTWFEARYSIQLSYGRVA